MKISEELSHKISFASLLCAAMVVGIHVDGYQIPWSGMWLWNRFGHNGVFLIAVPFFFTVSGFMLAGHYACLDSDSRLFDWGVWRDECVKRIRSLLVPYLIWCSAAVLLACVPAIAANLLHGRDLLANTPSGWRWWTIAYGLYPFTYPNVVPLWYLRTLMILVFISPLLYLTVKWGGGAISYTYGSRMDCRAVFAGRTAQVACRLYYYPARFLFLFVRFVDAH